MDKWGVNNQICVKIIIYKGCNDSEVIYYRNKLQMWIIEQWRWYFEYIAALVKVSNPRKKVELIICAQTLLQGQKYIEEKTKTMLRAKKAQVKKLGEDVIDDDLFGFKSQHNNEKKERIQSEIDALERGEFNYYVPVTYINRIKNWIK